jgi:hypothetical protein
MQNEDSPVLVSVPDETPQSSGVELTVRGYRPPEMTRRSYLTRPRTSDARHWPQSSGIVTRRPQLSINSGSMH